jgi:hypothetical protein
VPLARGRHVLVLRADGGAALDSVAFEVRGSERWPADDAAGRDAGEAATPAAAGDAS